MKPAFGLSIPETLHELCDPTRCALIVYDMQAGIVSQIPDGQQIVEACARLLASARGSNMRVFYTRHMFLPNQSVGVGQLRRSMIWQRKDDPSQTVPLMLQGDSSWEIVPELSPIPGDVILDKITMSAFESTFLNLALRNLQLKILHYRRDCVGGWNRTDCSPWRRFESHSCHRFGRLRLKRSGIKGPFAGNAEANRRSDPFLGR